MTATMLTAMTHVLQAHLLLLLYGKTAYGKAVLPRSPVWLSPALMGETRE